MDFKAFLWERLHQVDAYLISRTDSNRAYALGRVLELEQLAFSLRNGDLLTVAQYDEFDGGCERVRRRHVLHAAFSDFKADRPYNGRFLSPEASLEASLPGSRPNSIPVR